MEQRIGGLKESHEENHDRSKATSFLDNFDQEDYDPLS